MTNNYGGTNVAILDMIQNPWGGVGVDNEQALFWLEQMEIGSYTEAEAQEFLEYLKGVYATR